MSRHPHVPTNLEALDSFWRRSPFHDRLINDITALNRRVVIRLVDLTLVITEATDLKRCELPALWIAESVRTTREGFRLEVRTDTGPLRISGGDIRLIRNSDLAMLIPPIDV